MHRAVRASGWLLILLLLLAGELQAASLRVERDWLVTRLQQQNLLIVDARPAAEYRKAHIPGAVNLPAALSYAEAEQGDIIPPLRAQALFRQLGIDTDRSIVVYDGGELTASARVLWVLEVYGLKQVKILNGGFLGWQESDLVTTDEPPLLRPSRYVVQIDQRRIASKFITLLATFNPQQQIIDARSVEAYRGERSSAQRAGHIPTAINIPVYRNFSPQTDSTEAKYLLPTRSLAKVYETVPKTGKVVIYCEAGNLSSTNYLVLRELGYNVANYDASWREWGNDLSLPIEK